MEGIYSKETFLFDTLFPFAHSVAVKFRDCNKSTESKWLDQFVQQTVLCVYVKEADRSKHSESGFYGIV
jgi:hypothetical protein